MSSRSSGGGGSSSVKLAGEEAKDKMYEPKHTKKLVRVLTVVAYMFSVSLAAIMLSIYYVFLWQPADNLRARQLARAHHGCQQAAAQPYSAVQTTATPAASISPVIKYLTRVKTTTQPTVNITAAEEDFASPTRPLHGT